MSMIIGNVLPPNPSTVCKRTAQWIDNGHTISVWRSPSLLDYYTIHVGKYLVAIGTGVLVPSRSLSAQIANAHDHIVIH